jgi:hypothetical protein
MDPEHAGLHANEGLHGSQGGRHFFPAVADERRQQRGGSELAVRRDDRANSISRRRIVEQYIAAAIDLDIDEAGREPGVFGQLADRHRPGDLRARNDGGDLAAVNQHGCVLAHDAAVENAPGGDGVHSPAHRVRVTFCKCRGRSMSAPRCAARRTRNA